MSQRGGRLTSEALTVSIARRYGFSLAQAPPTSRPVQSKAPELRDYWLLHSKGMFWPANSRQKALR